MNIAAVAEKAGVSTATVSRTINGLPSVRPKTAAKVRRAIALLGFHPDNNARALGSGRSSLYGLIISDITNPFFPEVVRAFEQIATKHQRDILIGNTDYDPARMENCVHRMLSRKVDGVAIMTSEMDRALLESFSSRNIPLVVLDSGQVGPKMSNIAIDYEVGMIEAISHLVSLGHQRIGFVTGPLKLVSANLRYGAFLSARKLFKLGHSLRAIFKSDHSMAGGYSAACHLLKTYPQMTALVCSNDLSAFGALQAAYELGLHVPDDLSIVGYDDIKLSAFAHPALTTVSVPRQELAEIAFKSLFRFEEEDYFSDQGEQHRLVTSLTQRGSTARPPSPARLAKRRRLI